MSDPVNHPKHYTSHPSGIECIQITRHMGFNLGNAIKYIWRADMKGGVEDLEKAIWYLQDEIKERKKEKTPAPQLKRTGEKINTRLADNFISGDVKLIDYPFDTPFYFYLNDLPLKCVKPLNSWDDHYFACKTETLEFPIIQIHESAMVTPIAATTCQTPRPTAHPSVTYGVNPPGPPPSAPMPPPCDGLAAVQKRAQSAS